MKKGIHEIRRSIKQRKRVKLSTPKKADMPSYIPILEEGEKYTDQAPVLPQVRMFKGQRKLVFRIVSSVLLFVIMTLVLQTNTPFLQSAKHYTTSALEEEFPFAKVNNWYVANFGNPITLTSFTKEDKLVESALPLDGEVVETFATNGMGIRIGVTGKEDIGAYEQGVVIFAGNDPDTEKTVIIQHADNTVTTYGHLHTINVHVYATVQANSKIGTFQPSTDAEGFYFQMKKDDQYVDPTRVMPVHEG